MKRISNFAVLVVAALLAAAPAVSGVVYCVGEGGTILTLQPDGWHAVPTGPGTDIPSGDYSGIWGSGEDDIYITRNAPDIITWDGAAWGAMTLDVAGTRYFYDVHGTSANDILLLAHDNGFGVYPEGTASPPMTVSYLYLFDGVSWSELASLVLYPRPDVFLDPSGNAYLAGMNWDLDWNFTPAVEAYEDGEWYELGCVDVSFCDFDYARGLCLAGTLVHCLHYGSYWDPMSGWPPKETHLCYLVPGYGWLTRTSVPEPMQDAWASSMNSIWMVGDNGQIRHFDGAASSTQASGTTQHLRAVWGEDANRIFAVGDGGAIVHWDGSSWEPMASGTTENLNDIWGAGIVATVAGETPAAPLGLAAFPNPFNPSTTISFTLPTETQTTVRIHDARGTLVRTLLDGRCAAGPHSIAWDGKNDRGTRMPSGIYLVSLRAGERSASHKLALVR